MVRFKELFLHTDVDESKQRMSCRQRNFSDNPRLDLVHGNPETDTWPPNKRKTLNSTGDHWDCTIRSLARGLKWITICFMQIEGDLVQNYRENCWICHWNSLGKKQFSLAVAETVVAGTQRVHWTPLMSVFFLFEFLSNQTTHLPKVNETNRRRERVT